MCTPPTTMQMYEMLWPCHQINGIKWLGTATAETHLVSKSLTRQTRSTTDAKCVCVCVQGKVTVPQPYNASVRCGLSHSLNAHVHFC